MNLIIFNLRPFLPALANWTSRREGNGYRGTRATPFSFLKEHSCSFICQYYSTDTFDFGSKSRPKNDTSKTSSKQIGTAPEPEIPLIQ